MPIVRPILGILVAAALLTGATACHSGGGSGADAAPLTVSCPAATKTAFARTRFATGLSDALGVIDRSVYEPARAGRFAGSGTAVAGRRATAERAIASARRTLRVAASDARAYPPVCRAVGRPLARLDERLRSFPDALHGGDAAAAALQLRAAEQALRSAASRQNLAISPNPEARP